MMQTSRSLAVTAPLLVALAAANVQVGHQSQQWENKVDDEGRNVQSLQIQAPSMTEEDQYGYNMPDQYRCDSCKVVMHHLTETLKRRQPKNRRLQEWEYQDIYDETCKSGLAGYGVALVDGQNVLSGPAIKRDNLKPGMGAIQMGGETWEKRLGEICRKIVYDKIGEGELYEHFRGKGVLSPDLCFSETRDCQVGPKAPASVEAVKKTTKPKKEKNQANAKIDTSVSRSGSPDIDISTFIGKLAKEHGVEKSEYTRKRSFYQWEQLLLQASKRISEQTLKQAGQVVDV